MRIPAIPKDPSHYHPRLRLRRHRQCRELPFAFHSGVERGGQKYVRGHAGQKLRIHQLFPDPSDFARVVVDVHRVARPTVSFLDLTSVIEGQGVADAVRPVGLVLGGTDAVALDTLAAHAVGYDDLTLWTSIHGSAVGLGSNQLDRIILRGADWPSLPRARLAARAGITSLEIGDQPAHSSHQQHDP